SLGLGFVDRGLGVRLGLGDELLGVALGAGDQGLGLLVGLAANLLGTLVRGRGPGFGVGRTCLGVVDELLGLGDRSLVALVDLALELFTLGDELQLVLGVLLLRLDLGFVQDGLGLCAHGLGLALGGGALLLDFALGRGPQLGDLALGDGSQPADLSLGLRPALAGLVIDRRTNLGGLALGGFDQVRRFAVGRGTNLFGLDPRFVDELVGGALGVGAHLLGLVLSGRAQLGGIDLGLGAGLTGLAVRLRDEFTGLFLGEPQELLDTRTQPRVGRSLDLSQLCARLGQLLTQAHYLLVEVVSAAAHLSQRRLELPYVLLDLHTVVATHRDGEPARRRAVEDGQSALGARLSNRYFSYLA